MKNKNYTSLRYTATDNNHYYQQLQAPDYGQRTYKVWWGYNSLKEPILSLWYPCLL